MNDVYFSVFDVQYFFGQMAFKVRHKHVNYAVFEFESVYVRTGVYIFDFVQE